MPITEPSAWNQNGSLNRESRRPDRSGGARSRRSPVPSVTIRVASHGGTRPPCSGRSATPDRFTVLIVPLCRRRIRRRAAGPCDTLCPPIITHAMFRVLRMSARGSPRRSTRSARRPGEITPISERRSAREALSPVMVSTSSGENPASTSSANSLPRPEPIRRDRPVRHDNRRAPDRRGAPPIEDRHVGDDSRCRLPDVATRHSTDTHGPHQRRCRC